MNQEQFILGLLIIALATFFVILGAWILILGNVNFGRTNWEEKHKEYWWKKRFKL